MLSITVAIIGQKGGSGKTTTGIELAVAATRAGKTVAVIDLDPQANAANWKDRREAEAPAVVSAQASRLRQTVELARDNGADFVVIDTPGKSDSIAIDAARLADLVLVPAEAQIFNLETLSSVRDLLRVAGDPPAFVVLTKLHPQATRGAEEAKEMTERLCGLKASSVHLCQRNSYRDAPAAGLAAQEIDERAAEEMKRLYMFVCKHVDMSRSKHGEKPVRRAARSA